MGERVSLTRALRAMKLPAILAFGNPLLDIIVVLNQDGILKKYNLEMDGQQELRTEKMQQLINDLPPELEKTITAGGSAQNTMRVLQWLFGGPNKPNVGIFYGGLGKDTHGFTLENLVRAAGVETRYAVHQRLPTGVGVSMINGSSRSLVADLGAASVYTIHDLRRNNLPLDSVRIIYIEGFFVTHSIDVARELVKLAREKNIVIAFNLNGVYIFQDHHAEICEMVGLAKVVFGNAREMTALANALNLDFDNVEEIPFLLNNLKRVTVDVSSKTGDDWLTEEGVIVMTQGGSSPAIVVWGQGKSAQVHPETLGCPVVDTTGAGDSFVSGFLAGALAGWDPKSCTQLACRVAGLIVTRIGVTLPDYVPTHILQ